MGFLGLHVLMPVQTDELHFLGWEQCGGTYLNQCRARVPVASLPGAEAVVAQTALTLLYPAQQAQLFLGADVLSTCSTDLLVFPGAGTAETWQQWPPRALAAGGAACSGCRDCEGGRRAGEPQTGTGWAGLQARSTCSSRKLPLFEAGSRCQGQCPSATPALLNFAGTQGCRLQKISRAAAEGRGRVPLFPAYCCYAGATCHNIASLACSRQQLNCSHLQAPWAC